MTRKLFVDAHCHFFSAQHIPLTQTIQRIQKNMFGSTLSKVKIGAAATVAAPVLPLFGVVGDNLIDKLLPFIRFFDTSAADSIKVAIDSLYTVDNLDIHNRTIIFTPLIMDFEPCVPYKRLKDQVDDLSDNIKSMDSYLQDKHCFILPFLGLDFRRLEGFESDGVGTEIDRLITSNVDQIKALNSDDLSSAANNGSYIGIKLYPSLGWDIWPTGDNPIMEKKRLLNVAIVDHLAEKQFPVTVHCQTDSYECGGGDVFIESDVLMNYAHPKKWQSLLDKADANEIRLNLAHFGGEDDISKMLLWDDEELAGDDGDQITHSGIREKYGWSYYIIKMIKQYKNVYTDLGAFDFSNHKAAASLLWLIYLDDKNELGINGEYKLIDKIMWGTDIPMTLFDHKNYKSQFDEFMKNTNLTKIKDDYDFLHIVPEQYTQDMTEHAELIEKFINVNPANFLFGDN